MIFLTDRIGEEAGNLIYSFARAGADVQTVVSSYDGFMAEELLSPYSFYVNGKKPPKPGLPRYFNQIDLPDYWEIESTTTAGEIHDYEDLRARLFYADPKSERHLKIIDWLDKNGKVRCSDHYDRYGKRFAQTILDRNQKTVHKSYYDSAGREVITENLTTGDIILTDEGRNYFFKSKAEFIAHFLETAGLAGERLFFNSLATPFFAAERLQMRHRRRDNILFWQEPIREDIPGNMRSILERNAGGVTMIAVQSLGYIYPNIRKNKGRPEVLIFTNSDQVEKIGELTDALPDVHFHIGALTEMSAKLLILEMKENVTLYPVVWEAKIDELWKSCDIYLDINHGGEILEAVKTAFVNNQLILAFNNTAHNRLFTVGKNIYAPENYEGMAGRIREVLADKGKFKEAVREQRLLANEAAERDYQSMLE